MADFYLKEIRLRRVEYGADEGTYKGTIAFSNTEDTFIAELPPERCAAYLDLVAEEVVRSANGISKRLKESLTPQTEPPEQEGG